MAKKSKDILCKIEKSLEEFEANLTNNSNRDFQLKIYLHMNKLDIPLLLPSTILEKFDKVLLHYKVAKPKHSECSTYKECFLSITLVVGEYHHCYNKKTLPKNSYLIKRGSRRSTQRAPRTNKN
ncbi:20062_t:CDS:1 [Gigaspora rosea]|nr:20062_t:CDS:1 [Gigaspora rosea]